MENGKWEMDNLILDNLSLILLLPLWIFLIIMGGRFFSVYVNKKIIYLLTLLSSFLGICVTGYGIACFNESVIWSYPFIKINDFIIRFGLQIDMLSLVTVMILFIVSFAIQLFSISYMKDEKRNYKFFALLNLFNFSMAFLIFSPNLFQFYIFWELVGLVSYLLIGFNYKDITKSEASKRVFLMNRIGDTALLAGIVISSYYMFTYANKTFTTLSFEDFNAISTFLMAYTTTPAFYAICGLFVLAAMVKSAQFPFYTWLQDAMEAELPVSALLHSATMVVAGVYLIIRMMPFFTLSPVLMNVVSVTGILTAVICSVLASIETHPKKILAYSTSANLGLMFFAAGLGYVRIALILLIAHAFIKSGLFISLPKEKQYSKLNFIFFIFGALSLAGILFAGIGAKELIFTGINNKILSILFMFVSFMTGFYISRLGFVIYKSSEFIQTGYITKVLSYAVLLCGNIALYLMLRQTYTIEEPYAAAIGGIALALLMGKNNALEKFNQTPKILERIYNNFIPIIYNKISFGLDFIDNKILSNYKPILFLSKYSVKIVNWIEINIMNKSVSLVSNISKEFSRRGMLLQDGNIQTYNAYAFIIVSVIIALVIIGYLLIFGGG